MRSLIALIAAGLIAVPAFANPVRADHIEVELIPATTGVEPGGTLTLALRLNADEHWHTYWKNPGDSGLATHIDWTLPDGCVCLCVGVYTWQPTWQSIRS